jgi:hypothetical protein
MSLLSWLWSGTGTGTVTAHDGSADGVGILRLLKTGGAGLGIAVPTTVSAVGQASGTATVTGIGRALGPVSAVGLATGTASASAISRVTSAAVGTATGTATVTGVPFSLSINVGALEGIRLEFALPGIGFAPAAFQANAFGGSGWVSVMGDTLDSDPIVLDYGVQGNGPDDRVGSTGTLSFTLNNNANNQAGIVSYYSPLHPNHRAGHALNVPVRLVFEINGQDYHKFLGRLAESTPEPGRHGAHHVACLAVDLMDDWAANDLPFVPPILQNTGAATAVDFLLTNLSAVAPDQAPATKSLETSVDVLPFVFHDPNRKKIRELIIDAVMSDFGFASFRGGPNSAGNFFFSNRHAPSTYPINASLINQFSVADGFQAVQSRDALASSIEVFVHPVAVDDQPVELFKLDGSPLLVLPFQTTVTHLPFRYAGRQDSPVAALEVLPLVPGVDFLANTQEDGLGTDVTDNFIITHLYPDGGFEAVLQITNYGPHAPTVIIDPITPSPTSAPHPSNVPPGFLTLLKGRGRGLYISEASAKVDLDTTYGRRPLQIVMPWQANVNTASDIAHFFGTIHRNPFAQVDAVTFCANKTQTLMEAAIFLEPGALVYIQEDVTGIAGNFRIQSVHLDIHHDIVWCTWRLQNIDRQQFWLLGIHNRSDLGFSTILGY